MNDVATQLEPAARSITPSGLVIEYFTDPRHYTVDGQRVPSVTEVLGVLHKPALTWWGMKVGVEGVAHLCQTEWLNPVAGQPWDTEEVVRLLTEHKLTVNHQRDKAADRGTSVHNALERWAHTGHLPHPPEFPEEEQGYVTGLRAFLEAVQPEPIHTELMVGSAEYEFAGRFDLFAATNECEVKPTPRKTRLIPIGRGIWDLKTSKGIYGSHLLQLAAYRLGLEESRYGRSDYEAVVQVGADGSWDVKANNKRPEHFLAVRAAWAATR